MAKVSIVLSATALTLAGICVFLWQQRHAGREVIAEQRALMADLERGPAVAPDKHSALPQRQPESLPAPAPMPEQRETVEDSRRQDDDPVLRAAFIKRERIELRKLLKDLPYWMNVSDQDLQAFIDLRAEQVADRRFLFPESAPDARSAATVQRENELVRQQDQEIRDFLGEERFEGYGNWQRAYVALSRLGTMNAQSPPELALQGAQLQKVASAMAQAEQRAQQESQALAPRGRDPNDPAFRRASLDWVAGMIRSKNEAMRDAAAPYLSARQLKALDGILTADTRNFEASLDARRRSAGKSETTGNSR